MKGKIIYGMIAVLLVFILLFVSGCETRIKENDNYNFITWKSGSNREECLFAGYVHEDCVKEGTNDMNTHTFEEMMLFNGCCESICYKLNYTTTSTVADEFNSECFCMIPNSPLRISLHFDVNFYKNYTNECDEYVKAQYHWKLEK